MEIDNNEQNFRTNLTGEFAGLTVQTSYFDWTNIHANFTSELVQAWKNQGFTYEQVRDWADTIGPNFNPCDDLGYVSWLIKIKSKENFGSNDQFGTHYDNSEWVLNYGDDNALRQEYQRHQWSQQSQAQILYQS